MPTNTVNNNVYVCTYRTQFSKVIWSTFFTDSLSDHGKPKKNMNACTEVIFTVFKVYILAYTCKELGIDSDVSLPIPSSASTTEKLKFIVGLGTKVAQKCIIMKDPLVGKTVSES